MMHGNMNVIIYLSFKHDQASFGNHASLQSVQEVLPSGAKRPGDKSDHSSPFSAEVMNE